MARDEVLRAIISAQIARAKRSFESLAEGVRDTASAALQGSAAMDAYEGRVEESGEEAREATLENLGLAASLRAVGAAAGEASVNVGPFNTSVRRAVIALPALVGLVGSLATVLGGITVAAGGAAGALSALFAGGLVGRAQALDEASSELEGTTEALGQIMMQFAEAVDQATQPLQSIAMQDATMEFLDGLVTLFGDLARSAAHLAPLFGEVADRLGEVFWEEEARGIAQVEQTITELMPLLEALVGFILRQLPDLFAFLREETLKVGPAVADFAVSLVPVIANLIELSNTILQVVLPPLTILLDAIAVLLDLLAAVPKEIHAIAATFTLAAASLFLYSGAATVATLITGALNTALGSLLSTLGAIAAVVGLPVVAVAALIAAIVGLITWLELWDDILSVLKMTWNGILEIIEFVINGLITLTEWVWNSAESLSQLRQSVWWLGRLFHFLGQAVNFVVDGLKWLARQAEPIISSVSSAIGELESDIDRQGGVQLDRFKAGRAEERRGARRGPTVSRRAGEIQENRTTNNFDFSGATFGSGVTERDIERVVEKALEKKQSRTSDT